MQKQSRSTKNNILFYKFFFFHFFFKFFFSVFFSPQYSAVKRDGGTVLFVTPVFVLFLDITLLAVTTQVGSIL